MREIKFRAWDGDKFYQPILAYRKVFRDDRDFEDYIDCTDPLQQYTGLKDKNGKEIYEGDIVLFSGDDKELIKKMTVEWTEAEFVLLIDTKDWAYSLSGTPSSCLEVIGNIYENPDLLEGDN